MSKEFHGAVFKGGPQLAPDIWCVKTRKGEVLARGFPTRAAAREVRKQFPSSDPVISRGQDHPEGESFPTIDSQPKKEKKNMGATTRPKEGIETNGG